MQSEQGPALPTTDLIARRKRVNIGCDTVHDCPCGFRLAQESTQAGVIDVAGYGWYWTGQIIRLTPEAEAARSRLRRQAPSSGNRRRLRENIPYGNKQEHTREALLPLEARTLPTRMLCPRCKKPVLLVRA